MNRELTEQHLLKHVLNINLCNIINATCDQFNVCLMNKMCY